MLRKIRLFLRDIFIRLPYGKLIQRKVWKHREKIKKIKFDNACKRLHEIGPDVLIKVNETLNSAHIQFYLDYGTLLGCIREQNFLIKDDDIDILIPDQDIVPQRILSVMEDAGFEFIHYFEYEDRIIEYCFGYKGIHIDFFMNRNIGTLSESYVCVREMDRPYPSINTSTCYWSRRYVSNTSTLKTIAGIDMPVPDNYEDLLVFYYGDDWRIPQPDKKHDGRYKEDVKGELPGFAFVYNERSRLLSK